MVKTRQMIHGITYDSEESEVDDITWNDLDMDNVFFRINHTQSFLGEQILYHRLHNTNSKRDWDLFEKKVKFFDENEDLRIRLEKRLHGIGKAQESYYLTRLIKHTSDAGIKETVILRLLQIILLVCLVGAIFFKQTICMIGLIIIVAVNITVYTYKKTKTEGMLTCFKNLSIIIKFCQFIRSQKDLPAFIYKGEINNDIDKLKKLAKMTGAFSSNRIMSNSDPQALFVDYLMGITLWDLTNYNHIIKVIKGNEDAVMRVLQYVGEIDMDISIASFRRSVDKYCLPDFKNNRINIKLQKQPKFIVSGSATELTASQIAKLKDEYEECLYSYSLKIDDIIKGVNQEFIERICCHLAKGNNVLVYTSDLIQNREEFQQFLLDNEMSFEGFLTKVSGYLSNLVELTLNNISAILILIGGETSFECCNAINSEILQVIDEVTYAIPLCMDYKAQLIVTKSGNLGNANTLVDIIKYFDCHDDE
ncbi:MAG: hypothetical protein BHW64_04705 [Candidatus Melainabacteria bacterium LEY3_CP_29_8]|nr:MAG: hypothetical protein BHW64_04705 [Candidatus Melainabacteria bacterium LEY3_CP_29_8]